MEYETKSVKDSEGMLCPKEMKLRHWQPLGVCLRNEFHNYVVDATGHTLPCDIDYVMKENLETCTTIVDNIETYKDCMTKSTANETLFWLSIPCHRFEEVLHHSQIGILEDNDIKRSCCEAEDFRFHNRV